MHGESGCGFGEAGEEKLLKQGEKKERGKPFQ